VTGGEISVFHYDPEIDNSLNWETKVSNTEKRGNV